MQPKIVDRFDDFRKNIPFLNQQLKQSSSILEQSDMKG